MKWCAKQLALVEVASKPPAPKAPTAPKEIRVHVIHRFLGETPDQALDAYGRQRIAEGDEFWEWTWGVPRPEGWAGRRGAQSAAGGAAPGGTADEDGAPPPTE